MTTTVDIRRATSGAGGVQDISQDTPDVTVTERAQPAREVVFHTEDLGVVYGDNVAVSNISIDIAAGEITALIGPSGCGKSSLIRCFNRMNDLIPGARVIGKAFYRGADLYAADVDPVEVRR